jgi:SAM-dependent methyltransferase
VLDLGAGTGAASRAALAAGAASVVAVDTAFGMLAHDAAGRPPAAVGDALRLPLAAISVDVAVAAFSLNHLTDPAAGLREMARVTRAGGALVAGSYAADDTHLVKGVVESTLRAHGWEQEPWYGAIRTEAVPLLATVEGCAAAAVAAGLDATCESVQVPFPDLDAHDLVAWRLGMANHAPFVAGLGLHERAAVVAEAVAALGQPVAPLVRSIIVMSAVMP